MMFRLKDQSGDGI